MEVHLAAHCSDASEGISAQGILIHSLQISRSGLGLLPEIRCFLSIFRLLQRIRPRVVHLVTIKPLIYGGIACRILGIPTVAAIPGLGYAFSAKGKQRMLLRAALTALYRLALKGKHCRVIVQNTSDQEIMLHTIGIAAERLHLIHGSGVDLDHYQVQPEPANPLVIVMAARLLHDKGVIEFVEAARKVHQLHPEVRFKLVGDPDMGNPSSLSRQELEIISTEGHVEVCGFASDIARLFAEAHIVVLPSYREGLPKVLVEAAACGRAVVTTDVPGCRDAVIPNETALLVPAHNSIALSEAITRLIEEPALRIRMGLCGRALAESRFDIGGIVQAHLRIYRDLELRA